MQQCFLVNRSVLFVPRKDEAFSSINRLLTKLRTSNFFPGPARDDRLFFLAFVLVVVISSNNNDDFLSFIGTTIEIEIEVIKCCFGLTRIKQIKGECTLSRTNRLLANILAVTLDLHNLL